MVDEAAETVGLSPTAYARLRGVTYQAVMQRIAAGSMLTAARRVGKHWVLDPVKADEEWAAHTQPRVDARKPEGPSPPGGSTAQPSRLAEATRRERDARAETFELELARKKGLLVPAAGVEQLATDLVVKARTALLGLPTRARQRIPHLTAADAAVLEQLIREILDELAAGAERMPRA